jgi:hypothetical protein
MHVLRKILKRMLIFFVQNIVLEGDKFLHEVVPLATKDPEKEQNAEVLTGLQKVLE